MSFLMKVSEYCFSKFIKEMELKHEIHVIIMKYGLIGCESSDEFESRFNRLTDKEREKFLKYHPDIYEYLEHARKYPGTEFKSKVWY